MDIRVVIAASITPHDLLIKCQKSEIIYKTFKDYANRLITNRVRVSLRYRQTGRAETLCHDASIILILLRWQPLSVRCDGKHNCLVPFGDFYGENHINIENYIIFIIHLLVFYLWIIFCKNCSYYYFILYTYVKHIYLAVQLRFSNMWFQLIRYNWFIKEFLNSKS